MKLKQYLAKGKEVPPTGPTSEETDWMLVDRFIVSSGKLWIGDPGMAWAECRLGDGCTLKVPKGTYVVEAKARKFGHARLVTRLRTYLQGTKGLKLGKAIGEAGTDTAQMGVADPKLIAQALADAFGNDEDGILEALESAFDDDCGAYRPKAKATGCVVYVPSGFGDGGGPVWRLQASRQTVGVETEFISPEVAVGDSTNEGHSEKPCDIVVTNPSHLGNAKVWSLKGGDEFEAAIGENLGPGRNVEISAWTDSVPVEVRVRQGARAIIQPWEHMQKPKRTPSGSRCLTKKVSLPKAGNYAVDFRVNDKLLSPLEFKLLK
jgi:hypothetical protein